MFWSLVLPFQVACVVTGIFILIMFLFFLARKWHVGVSLLCALLLGAVLFIPVSTVIYKQIDAARFRGFAYPDFSAVDNFRVTRWLPEAARDITVYCTPMGHRARFQIEKDKFATWISDFRTRHGMGDDAQPLADEKFSPQQTDTEKFDSFFAGFGWAPPDESSEISTRVAANGAGFTVWYSETQGLAYLQGGYW